MDVYTAKFSRPASEVIKRATLWLLQTEVNVQYTLSSRKYGANLKAVRYIISAHHNAKTGLYAQYRSQITSELRYSGCNTNETGAFYLRSKFTPCFRLDRVWLWKRFKRSYHAGKYLTSRVPPKILWSYQLTDK